MLTPLQKQTAQAIVNLFETSSAQGDYGAVTVIAGDTGHLSFGRSQTTLGSGNLHALLQRYCDNAGARFGPRLAPWLQRVEQRDTTLDHGLGRQWQGYFVTRVASGTPAQIQTATTQPQDPTVQLAVTSASAFVADVWVF